MEDLPLQLNRGPNHPWAVTTSCPGSGDWRLTTEDNSTYSNLPLYYSVADGAGCKASYAFEGQQAVFMGRANSNLGVYGCSIDGEVTWHTAQRQENVYQTQLCHFRSLSSDPHVVAIFTPEVDPSPLWVLNLQICNKDTMLFPTDMPAAMTIEPPSATGPASTPIDLPTSVLSSPASPTTAAPAASASTPISTAQMLGIGAAILAVIMLVVLSCLMLTRDKRHGRTKETVIRLDSLGRPKSRQRREENSYDTLDYSSDEG